MAKNAELVLRFDNPIKRDTTYFYYLMGKEKGIIDGVYRSKMTTRKKKEALK